MKPRQQFPDPEQRENQRRIGSNDEIKPQPDDIELQFTFTKGTANFPLILKAPKQTQPLDREEARRVSSYFMKKFLLFDGGFEPYFKANTSSLNKGLSVVVSVLRIIAKKK